MPVETYHDVSFDKSEYEDFHDTLDLTAGEDSSRPLAASEYKGVSKNEVVPEYERMVRNKAVPEYERVAKNVDVNKYEDEILEPDVSDAEDYIQDEPFVPEEVYYTKAMNPKALGATEEMKARARAGIRKRRRMNEPTYKKIKRSIASLATVFAACTVAAASFSREAVTSPFDGSFDALQPFVSWMSGQPRREVDCYELFAGKARISEAFAKRGRGVLQPRDILFGHDLRDKVVQEEVLHDIRSYRPGLLWVAPPCTLWCGFSKLNHSPQQLRRLRQKEMALLRFVDSAIKLQKELGGLIAVENPETATYGALKSSRTTCRGA